MEIFIIKKTTQSSDSDGYMHFPDRGIVAYHLTREGAQQKIYQLIEKEKERIAELAKVNYGDLTWIDEWMNLVDGNKVSIQEGRSSDDNFVIHDYLVIDTLEVEE